MTVIDLTKLLPEKPTNEEPSICMEFDSLDDAYTQLNVVYEGIQTVGGICESLNLSMKIHYARAEKVKDFVKDYVDEYTVDLENTLYDFERLKKQLELAHSEIEAIISEWDDTDYVAMERSMYYKSVL